MHTHAQYLVDNESKVIHTQFHALELSTASQMLRDDGQDQRAVIDRRTLVTVELQAATNGSHGYYLITGMTKVK